MRIHFCCEKKINGWYVRRLFHAHFLRSALNIILVTCIIYVAWLVLWKFSKEHQFSITKLTVYYQLCFCLLTSASTTRLYLFGLQKACNSLRHLYFMLHPMLNYRRTNHDSWLLYTQCAKDHWTDDSCAWANGSRCQPDGLCTLGNS